MWGEVFFFEETINKTRCPQCQTSLKHRWLSQEEQEKLTFDTAGLEFRNGSQLSQVEVYFCPSCHWQEPSLLVKTEYENIPASEEKQKYSKERNLVEKIVSVLFPQQYIKVRFVKSIIFEGEKMMARTLLSKIAELENKEVISVCLFVKCILLREKTNPGFFCDVVAHELAHTDPTVFKNPQHNPDQKIFPNCSCRTDLFFNPHSGPGHDKVWHDKYDEFRERIKNEKLAEDFGYVALGKEFSFHPLENNQPELKAEKINEGKEKFAENSKIESQQKNQSNKIYWIIGSLVLVSLVGIVF